MKLPKSIEFMTGGQGIVIVMVDGSYTKIRLVNNRKGAWHLVVDGKTYPGDHSRIIHDHSALRDLVAQHIN